MKTQFLAEPAIRRLTKGDKKNPLVWKEYALFLNEKGRKQEAIEALGKTMALEQQREEKDSKEITKS